MEGKVEDGPGQASTLGISTKVDVVGREADAQTAIVQHNAC